MKKNKCITIEEAAETFRKVIDKIMTFDNEQDKINFLLDSVIQFKKEINKK